jgi:hypothetical protein
VLTTAIARKLDPSVQLDLHFPKFDCVCALRMPRQTRISAIAPEKGRYPPETLGPIARAHTMEAGHPTPDSQSVAVLETQDRAAGVRRQSSIWSKTQMVFLVCRDSRSHFRYLYPSIQVLNFSELPPDITNLRPNTCSHHVVLQDDAEEIGTPQTVSPKAMQSSSRTSTFASRT